jgi:2-polyprenyl-3-methyl-5-hydroxy-6-metoxy-1,4-benzoquinol methylase
MGFENSTKLLRDNMRFWNKYPCDRRGGKREESLLKLQKERYSKYYWLKPFINPDEWDGKDILEVGSGIGIDSSMFLDNGGNVVSLDLSSNSLQIAKCIFDGNFINASALNLKNLFRSKFDLVYSFGVLHHIPNMESVIDQIYSILKDDGEIILMLYNKRSLNYLKKFLVNGILRGWMFKGGRSTELIKNTERGASDELRPFMSCYTVKQVRKLLHKFGNVRTEIHHLSPSDLPVFGIPTIMLRSLETKLGWFILVRGAK